LLTKLEVADVFLFTVDDRIWERLGINQIDVLQIPSKKSLYRVKRGENYFFVKVAIENTPHAQNLKLEFLIHKQFKSDLICETQLVDGFRFLIMEELPRASSPSLPELEAALTRYRMNSNLLTYKVPKSRNFNVLLKHAGRACCMFHENGDVDTFWGDQISISMNQVRDYFTRVEGVICHGDVSANNLYQKNDILLLLDWEDCFWGYAGFDEIYFLSFLANREKLTESNLVSSGLDLRLAISTYIFIILLKEYINLSKASEKLQFSLQDRLEFIRFLL
jgi:hypothetical protein